MLNKYEVFVQVAETRNLTKVAERYHYSQSAISHALRALEEEIGLPLVHRAKNGITLTKYGEELLPDFRRIVCSRERLLQKADQFRGLRRGTLRVGAFTSVSMHWIPAVAEKFAAEYPNIQLIQSHSSYDGVEAGLQTGQLDIGFLSSYYKGNFEFMPLYQDEYLVLLPPDDPLAQYERIPIEALNYRRFVLMEEGGEYDAWHILSRIKGAEVVHYVNEDMLAVPLVEHGIGISILPKLILDGIATPAVKKRFAEPRYRVIGIAANSFKDAPPLAQLFIDLTKDYIETWDPDKLKASISY